jgi:hypothetical protein
LQHLDPHTYLHWLAQRAVDGVVPLTVPAITTALTDDGIQVSSTTVERCERVLAANGRILRRRGIVELLPHTTNGSVIISHNTPAEPVIISHNTPAEPVIISHQTGSSKGDVPHSDALSCASIDSIETQSLLPPALEHATRPDSPGEVVFLPEQDDGYWVDLISMAAPEVDLVDPAALAVIETDGLCAIPAELLPEGMGTKTHSTSPASDQGDERREEEHTEPEQPRSRSRKRKTAQTIAFGTAPASAKRRAEGLPRSSWPTADMPSLEAEVQRRRAMLRHLKGGPARRSVEHAIAALERLITERRDLGLVRMLYANAPEPQARGEPQAIHVGEAVAYAGGAAFTPPGAVSEAALRALMGTRTEQNHAPASSTAWRIACCDHRGNLTTYGIYWRAIGPDGAMTEPTPYRDIAERDARRAADGSAQSAEVQTGSLLEEEKRMMDQGALQWLS